MYFASVFTAVLCQCGTIHVEPISTWRFGRSMFMNRVLPTICPDFRSIVANPTESPAFCSDRTRSTYRLKSSIVLMGHGNQRNTSSKAPLVASQNSAECSSPNGSNRITLPSSVKGANSAVAGYLLTSKAVLQNEISRRRGSMPLPRQLRSAIAHARHLSFQCVVTPLAPDEKELTGTRSPHIYGIYIAASRPTRVSP